MRSKPLFIILGLLCLPFEVPAQNLFNYIKPDVLKDSGRTESAQVTVPVRTMPGAECDDGFEGDLFRPVVDNCKLSEFVNDESDIQNSEMNEFCKCMDSKSNSIHNARYIKELTSPTEEEIRKRRSFYVRRLLHVYQQLNYGVSAQESIYSMSSSNASKVAGCTEKEIANKFIDEIQNKTPVEIRNKGACGEPGSNACLRSIETVKKEYASQVKDYDEKKISGPVKEFCGLIPVDGAKADDQASREEFNTFKNNLKKMGDFYKDFPGLIDQENKAKMDNLIGASFEEYSNDCSDLEDSFNKIKFEYDIKSQIIENPIEVTSHDIGMISSKLKENNEKISEAVNNGYDQLKDGACISYKNFQVINSAPKPELLNSLGSSHDSFDILTSDSNSQEMKFLRRNPVLAKLATSTDGRRFIFNGLNKMKNTLGPNPSDADRIKAFNQFMSNDVANFSSKNGLNDVHLCSELGKSLSKVFATNDIPYTKFHSESIFSSVKDNYHLCQEHRGGGKRVTDLEENLSGNPFYRIMDRNLTLNRMELSPGPDSDEEYNHFIYTNCPGFKEHKKQHLGKCDGPLSLKGCYDKFHDLSKAKTKQLLASYYADVNPELGKLIAIAEGETKDPTKKDLDKRTTEKFQDKEVKDHYRKKVLPKLASTSSSSASGSAKTQAEIQQVLASEQASYNETHDKSFANPKSKGPVNDNQVVPKAARLMENQPAPLATPITPETFRSVNRGTEFLDRNLTDPNERLNDISRKKESVETEAESLMNMVNSDEERKEIIKQEKQILADLEREKKQILKEIGDASNRSPSGIFQSPIVDESYSSGSPVQTSGSVQPFVPQGRPRQEVIDQKAAMNKALLDTKYVSNPMGTVLLGNQYAELPQFQNGIEVVKSIDVNKSQFEAIKNAESLEELNLLIAKQLPIPYKDPDGVIAIVDPRSGNEMFFEVTAEDGGNRIKVKLVSSQSKIEPKIRRKFERKTLKGFFTQTP